MSYPRDVRFPPVTSAGRGLWTPHDIRELGSSPRTDGVAWQTAHAYQPVATRSFVVTKASARARAGAAVHWRGLSL